MSNNTQEETDRITQRFKELEPTLNRVWDALRKELLTINLENVLSAIPRPQLAAYQLEVDPFDQSETLIGTWRGSDGSKIGEIKIRQDGNIYAEIDVIRNHPVDVRWFVEAVTAWGNSENLKTELRLLPSL